METFTIGLRSPWWIRALGRNNPLVRRSDRIEAAALILVVVFAVVAIPIVGAIGTSVHDEHTRAAVEEAKTRHEVIATATEQGQVVPLLRTIEFSAEATWVDAGTIHQAVVPWPTLARVGDQQSIWVNEAGDNVARPSSPSRSAGEAIGIALGLWLAVAELSVALMCLVRRQLNHSRYAQWDREIAASRDNGGRRNHQS